MTNWGERGAMTGGGDSFAAFVRDHTRTLYGTACMLTRNHDSAEELLQDTLVRLYPKWDSVEAADNSVAYVRRALVNAFISDRRRFGQRAVFSEASGFGQVADIADMVTDRRFLLDLLERLPERQRTAIVLHCLYDMPDADIAAALECRVATVRSLVSRGIAAMRAHQGSSGASTPGGAGERR